MRLRRAFALAMKDLRETFSTSQLALPLVVVPFVVVVGYPMIYLVALRFTPGAADGLQGFLTGFPASAVPNFPGMDSAGRAAYIGIVYLFAGFFLLVPVMVSTIIAANSFAGEKERRTLEGLLYTPVTDAELVLGKIAASFVPAVAFTWFCFLIYAVIANVMGAPLVGGWYFPTTNWWALMLALVPAVALFVISLVVLVSAKVRGFQEANAIGGSISLPLIGIVAAQASGIMVLSAGLILAVAAAFAVLDLALMVFIVSTFDRARIVSFLP